MLKEILSFLTISTFVPVSFASAQTTIYPIPVEVEKNKTMLTVRDDGTRYIAKIYRWIQEGGEDKLLDVDDKEAVVFPSMFRARPEGIQIKIAILKERQEQEQAYRIILEEVKTENKIVESGISIQKVFSIPVFFRGKNEYSKYSISCKNKTIEIKNEGTKHIKIVGIDDKQENQYVLPGSFKQFSTDNKVGVLKLSDNSVIRYICF